jgi:hypothetical protein
MNFIQSFYKTRTLVNNGVFIAITVLILVVAGFFISDFAPKTFSNQIYTLNGYNTKHNDPSEVSDFLLSIKNNNGFLVLGTSESTSLKKGNYYDFLNNDQEIRPANFSILSGAGRTCGIYIPLFLQHRDELDSLKLIYFINPVYWRSDLCEVNLDYWNRYSNYKMSNSLVLTKNEKELFFKPVKTYNDKMNSFNKFIEYTEQSIRTVRRNYFHKLRYQLFPDEYKSQFSFMSASQEIDYSNYLLDEAINLELIDTNYNVLKSFSHKEWFNPINEDVNYRYKELNSFILLCHELGVKATFVIGPYNHQFIKKYSPNSLAAYTRTSNRIKQLLLNNNTDLIDASDISIVSGAFNDHQHHSNYGAYLIYLKLKEHFYE